jgi:hypothetical protein
MAGVAVQYRELAGLPRTNRRIAMSNYPPESYPPQGGPPGGYMPGPQYGVPYPPPGPSVSGRVIPPAVGLIIVAVLNFLLGLYLVVNGVFTSTVSDEQFEKQMASFNPSQKEQLEKAGWSVESIKKLSVVVCFGLGGLAAFISLLTILGAIGMMTLKWYGLAVFVSVLAAIPFLSCMACCGLGEIVGIWALIVLLNPEVRAAFR